MKDSQLERWRKEIKAALRYEFIDVIVLLFYDPIKESITIAIKYTEDDRRCQAKEEFRLELLKKMIGDGPPDWKQILSETIQKYGKNRELAQPSQSPNPIALCPMDENDVVFPSGAACEDDIPTVVDVAPDAETVVDTGQNVEMSRKVKKVARFDEWKEAR